MTTENPNNFFDDLERQLVTATGDRTRRLRRARTRRVATLCTILVALLATGGGLAVALSNNATNDSGVGRPAATQPPTATATATATVPSAVGPCARIYRRGRIDSVDPSSMEVAVLNGTTVPGLARGVATRLQNLHFKIGTVTNAATQDRTTTQVYYGRAECIPAATEVASAIGLTSDFALKAMPTTVALLAGRGADVVVVVGSDQNLHG